MALLNTDLLLVQRGGVKYNMTADQLSDFLGAVKDVSVTDIAGRDALTGLTVGHRVFVGDASADTEVSSGWAIYRVGSIGPVVFDKIQEQESLDITVTVSLGYVAGTNGGTITNSGGADLPLPVVNATEAGLATPAMLANTHAAATSALTATTNPITVDANQQVDMDIGQLLALP